MSEGLNRVQAMGNLGADPELRHTQGGNPVLSFRMACTETYFDKDRQKKERTEWVSVVLWGKRGESLAKILAKGSRVYVEGRMQTSSFDDRDGNKRYKTEVVALHLILLDGKGGGTGGGGKSARTPAAPDDFDAPPGDGGSSGDDIPF